MFTWCSVFALYLGHTISSIIPFHTASNKYYVGLASQKIAIPACTKDFNEPFYFRGPGERE